MMSNIYSWIYLDHTNNIWNFFINDNKELVYTIMYEEGKWTKESAIDKDVLGFTLCVDHDETIHILYNNIKGEIKYCTLKDKQWMGKLVYLEDAPFEINDLKVEFVGSEMHIFYLLKDTDGSGHGALIHRIWDGNKTEAVLLQDIIFVSNMKQSYVVAADEYGNLNMTFITDEGDEKSVNHCIYQDGEWTLNRLYGIQGDKIDFEVLNYHQDIHILNKYMEDSIYFIVHIRLEMNDSIEKFDIYESKEVITEPFMFIENDQLLSCWLENNEIFYSVFDGEMWSEFNYLERDSEHTIKRYHCYLARDTDDLIEKAEAYGTDKPDLNLFFPRQLIMQKNIGSSQQMNLTSTNPEKNGYSHNLEMELSKLKSENKRLHKTITSLNMQLQKMHRYIKDYEGQIARTLEEKQKSDENSKLFMEIQQNLQKELEYVKTQLLEEQNIKTNIEGKLENYEEANAMFKEEIEKLNKERQELSAELELEKNKTIVDRFFK